LEGRQGAVEADVLAGHHHLLEDLGVLEVLAQDSAARCAAATSASTQDFVKTTAPRRLVNRAFTPRVVALMGDQVAAIVDALIDDLPESGTVDLVSAFAYPLAANRDRGDARGSE
jgi:cytochrome P450